ncbi:secreted RxLR effector protein 161-like [Vicia villosa]|uniref:secreted RxLR effector protein 161-like n=1 Tax=Vicia villosa TaxID=3911 RepID=UPI00273C057B|nr:secreted RxLR effector protein 161-like [Vicia villosa]
MLASKRILRYIKSTIDLNIFYWKGCKDELVAYTNIDYAGDIDDRKSTSGYVFMLSDGAVAWAFNKQPMVTLSTTEAEYVALVSCAFQFIWMQHILKQIKGIQSDYVTTFNDNSSTIKLAKNLVFYRRSKHKSVRFHFLRNLIKDGVTNMEFVEQMISLQVS